MSILEKRNCPVCGSENKEVVFIQKFNSIIGIALDKFEQNIVICKDCGMIYVSPFITDSALSTYYEHMSSYEYDGNNNDYPETHKKRSINQHNYIVKFCNHYNSVLDIGCSIGYTLSLFRQEGFDVLGLEPSEKNKHIAKEKYNVEVETKFLDKEGLSGRKFDIVILSHVAEHLKYPLEIFLNIKNILNDNGLLYVETPDIDLFDEQDLYQFYFEHINYFNLGSTKNLLQKAGFELVDSKIFYNDSSVAPFYPTLGSIWKPSFKQFKISNLYEANKDTIKNYINLIENFRYKLNDKIQDIILKCNNIAIFGAGTLTSQLFSQTSILSADIKIIFDNDIKKDGLEMNGIKIRKPELNVDFFKSYNINNIVIGSWSSQNEIYYSLKFLEMTGITIWKLFD